MSFPISWKCEKSRKFINIDEKARDVDRGNNSNSNYREIRKPCKNFCKNDSYSRIFKNFPIRKSFTKISRLFYILVTTFAAKKSIKICIFPHVHCTVHLYKPCRNLFRNSYCCESKYIEYIWSSHHQGYRYELKVIPVLLHLWRVS